MNSGDMFRYWLAVALISICTASTSQKREDGAVASSGSSGSPGPVYTNPNSIGSSSLYQNGGYDSAESSPGSSYKSSQPNTNLYYYYYPVQQKPQDQAASGSSTQNFIASPVSSGSFEPSESSDVPYPDQSSAGYGVGDSSYQSSLSAAYNPSYLAAYQGGYGSIPGYSPAASAVGTYPSGSSAYSSYVPTSVGTGGFQYAGISGYPAGGQYAGYTPQGNYAGNTRRYSFGSLIVPMLALAGLGLLIPSVTGLGSSRNKRSIDNPGVSSPKNPIKKIAEYTRRLEMAYDLYLKAIENDECVSRIICELGNAMSDVRAKKPAMSLVEKFAPIWMKGKLDIFKVGLMAADTAKCKAYKC